MVISDVFGIHVFTAEKMRQRLTEAQFAEVSRGGICMATADAVAEAMKNWALELGATHYCHWFQPLTCTTAEKHESFLGGVCDGRALLRLTGKQLLMGESDASSFPTGGLRETAYARGYTAWDMTSPAFIKEGSAGKILCIPTIFVSYNGDALDMKTPLLRSMEAVDRQARRILRLLGDTDTKRVVPMVGPEQEYFLVDQQVCGKRRDLMYCGRTLFGAPAPKGQELDDQYFGAIPRRAGAFMRDLNESLWKMGVIARVQHNEVAPAQHEMAPLYCEANVAVDQNQLTMETMKRLAERHGLVCLLHEKPFAGVNGSGKHNNWSLCTDSGENLMDPGEDPGGNLRFWLVMACILRAVDRHSDLLRLSAGNVGNDLRLGGQEAPPAVVSVFLGGDLYEILNTIVDGIAAGTDAGRTLDAGLSAVPVLKRDAADRNRTAAVAFTGNKFEFRMVGASDSLATANTVLNTITAEAFREAADTLEGAPDFTVSCWELVRQLLKKHRRIVYNEDCYSQAWVEEARRRGLPNLPSMVDAIPALVTPEAVTMFESFHVFTRRELESRAEVLYETYAKRVHIEAKVMLHMTAKDYIPAALRYLGALSGAGDTPVGECLRRQIDELLQRVQALSGLLETERLAAYSHSGNRETARAFRDRVTPVMEHLRAAVDALEMLVGRDYWPVPACEDLMFGV